VLPRSGFGRTAKRAPAPPSRRSAALATDASHGLIREIETNLPIAASEPPAVERTGAYASLLALPGCLSAFGIPPAAFLAQRGFDVREFRDWPGRFEVSRIDALLGDCVAATRCAHFGLLVGAGVGLVAAGILGRAARNAETVGQALQDLQLLPRLRDTVGGLHVATAGDETRFGFSVHAPGLRHADQVYDLMLGIMRNAMEELCGTDWQPALVQLPRRRPKDLQPYQAHLGRHLVFNATDAALVFPASTLQRSVPDADPLLRELVLRDAELQVVKREPALLAEVRRAIRVGLVDRDASRRGAAGRLGMHERTLGRRLQDAGTTFQSLLDETRVNAARELLQCTDAPVGKMAASLGYRDSTVFARAFRRHVGTTPRAYRERAAGRRFVSHPGRDRSSAAIWRD
jgi:AraC-like DNA-binding protein